MPTAPVYGGQKVNADGGLPMVRADANRTAEDYGAALGRGIASAAGDMGNATQTLMRQNAMLKADESANAFHLDINKAAADHRANNAGLAAEESAKKWEETERSIRAKHRPEDSLAASLFDRTADSSSVAVRSQLYAWASAESQKATIDTKNASTVRATQNALSFELTGDRTKANAEIATAEKELTAASVAAQDPIDVRNEKILRMKQQHNEDVVKSLIAQGSPDRAAAYLSEKSAAEDFDPRVRADLSGKLAASVDSGVAHAAVTTAVTFAVSKDMFKPQPAVAADVLNKKLASGELKPEQYDRAMKLLPAQIAQAQQMAEYKLDQQVTALSQHASDLRSGKRDLAVPFRPSFGRGQPVDQTPALDEWAEQNPEVWRALPDNKKETLRKFYRDGAPEDDNRQARVAILAAADAGTLESQSHLRGLVSADTWKHAEERSADAAKSDKKLTDLTHEVMTGLVLKEDDKAAAAGFEPEIYSAVKAMTASGKYTASQINQELRSQFRTKMENKEAAKPPLTLLDKDGFIGQAKTAKDEGADAIAEYAKSTAELKAGWPNGPTKDIAHTSNPTIDAAGAILARDLVNEAGQPMTWEWAQARALLDFGPNSPTPPTPQMRDVRAMHILAEAQRKKDAWTISGSLDSVMSSLGNAFAALGQSGLAAAR